MSKCFGYADDYKVIATNPVTLQVDAHRIWKWCQNNMMSLNLKKCKTVSFKGTSTVKMSEITIQQAEVEKDLGIIVSKSLTWKEQAGRRCEKAVRSLFLIKRNVSWKTSETSKKSLYKSYIVPIVSYGAVLWKASKTDLRHTESVQEKAVRWITGRRESYKETLLRLKLLPLSLYHELHVLLPLVDIIHKKYNLNWTNYLNVTKVTQPTRSENLSVFKTRQCNTAKEGNDFWTRACYLANKLGSAIGRDVHSTENPKREILHVYWTYFRKHYDPANICSWRLSCACSNCKNIKKLDFMINNRECKFLGATLKSLLLLLSLILSDSGAGK